jgi:hypothetical protein
MDTHMTIRTKRKAPPAVYALARQMLAVRRTVTARSTEESQRAARWALAWYSWYSASWISSSSAHLH